MEDSVQKTINSCKEEFDVTEKDIEEDISSQKEARKKLQDSIDGSLAELQAGLDLTSERLTARIDKELNELSESVIEKTKHD